MQAYKYYFRNRSYLISCSTGLILLGVSLAIQFFASKYATRIASDSVTDIVLSNTRVYDVGGIFIWGAIVAVLISVFLLLRHPIYSPFMMKSTAFFILIRSVFVSLTHISPFPAHVLIHSTFFTSSLFSGIFSGNDLFFSGHTGLPFLIALMFWKHKIIKYTFLSFSVLFACVVLLGHLHYSIDVLSAYFITYAIFDICKFSFKKDWELFLQG